MAGFSSHLPVLVTLVAMDEAGLETLHPAAEMLEAFGIGWEQTLFPPCAPWPGLARGCRMVIAAAGDAQLPAALARQTGLPVIRVPVAENGRSGLQLVQGADGNLPGGTSGQEAFATVAIGEAGAKNAALFVVSALALTDPRLAAAWREYRTRQTEAVLHGPALMLEG